MKIDVLEQGQLDQIKMDLTEKLDHLHQSFASKVKPEQGVYGVTEVLKDDGTLVRTGKNELGHSFKEYYRDGKIFEKREVQKPGQNITIKYDDNGTPYLKITKTLKDHKVDKKTAELRPNTKIGRGNTTSETDQYGRLMYAEIKDVQLTGQKHKNVERYDNQRYRKNDQAGHMISNMFGGSGDPSNIVPQTKEVNLSQKKRVENEIKRLVEDGHKVNYREDNHFIGKSKRPDYFEPHITVDGQEYDLPEDLRRIYNNNLPRKINDRIVKVDHRFGHANELGIKSGLTAAGITLAISSAENISAFTNGDIDGGEMAENIVKETMTAGALGYGTTFITVAVSEAMEKSSSALIQRVAGSCLPGAAVSFAVTSYHSISAFAQGKMDGVELAYDLGDNAASVAGGFAGGALAGGAAGTIAGPVGAVAGSIVGGVVGCALASEVYATAVELGSEGAEIVAEHAQRIAHETSEYVRENIPEKFDEVKTAFTDFFETNHLPCNNL